MVEIIIVIVILLIVFFVLWFIKQNTLSTFTTKIVHTEEKPKYDLVKNVYEWYNGLW